MNGATNYLFAGKKDEWIYIALIIKKTKKKLIVNMAFLKIIQAIDWSEKDTNHLSIFYTIS
jgi:short subunit fatty acids transporter